MIIPEDFKHLCVDCVNRNGCPVVRGEIRDYVKEYESTYLPRLERDYITVQKCSIFKKRATITGEIILLPGEQPIRIRKESKKVKRRCIVCGQVFYALAKKNRITCSMKCHYLYKK